MTISPWLIIIYLDSLADPVTAALIARIAYVAMASFMYLPRSSASTCKAHDDMRFTVFASADGCDRGRTHPSDSPLILISTAVSIVTLAIQLIAEGRAAEPLPRSGRRLK